MSSVTQQTKYCICCDEEVPYNKIVREGKVELTCIYCGFVLDVTIEEEFPMVECIITADDAQLTRELLKGMLLKRKLTKTVVSVEDGQEFVSAFTKRLARNQPVDLVILDLEMPVMDGITAARVMRSVEEKYQSVRVPILFFSAQKCNETLKRQLGMFAPASYVNKGNANDPVHLVERVDQLAAYLLHLHKST